MEVVLKNVSCKRNQQKLEKVNITIPSNQIVGLIGEERTLLLEYLDGLLVGTGSITFDGKKRTRENWEKMKKVTGLVPREMLSDTMFSTVEEQMRFFIQCYHVPVKNLDKKIKDSLKIVGFNGAYLQKSIHDLSISERKLVQIAYCLLTNPSMILLDEPFVNLDVTNQKDDDALSIVERKIS